MGRGHRRARMTQRRAGGAARSLADMPGSQRMSDREALEAVLAAMSDGVVVYDGDGHVVSVNAAMNRLLGVDVASASAASPPGGEASEALAHTTDASYVLAELIRQMGIPPGGSPDAAPEKIVDTPIPVRMPNGRERWLSVTRNQLRDGSGGICGTVAVFRDATDHHHLVRGYTEAWADATALRETVQHLEEFLAVAAHDLRSPLAVAMGHLQLTQRRFTRQRGQLDSLYPEFTSPFEAIRKGLSESLRGVQQLAQSVAVLLDVAKASAGRLELKRQRCDLVELVHRQVHSQRIAAVHRDIRLALLTDLPMMVNVDAVRVGEVVANYMTNALKYSAEERPVEVEVSMRDDVARVAVRDGGPGLSPREQERVWERYYRVPGVEPISDNSEGSGLGLGLHICKKIVEKHGGAVGVESMLGAGSTFWFTLPLASETTSEVPVAVAAEGKRTM